MIARIYASRHSFLVAGIAAVLAFLSLVWVSKMGERAQSRERAAVSPENRVTSAPAIQTIPAQAAPEAPVALDDWTPPPIEIIRLTASVTLRNARGKEVKQFSAGKRLRVKKRSGDTIAIDYLGDEYTIPTSSTEPWR